MLTLAATYPIASAPASYAYFGHADAKFVMWILAWDAHAVQQDPINLFNANIFHPAPDTLAYSETFLGYFPLFAPILWLHGSPALAFNAVLLFSFAASGFGMYLLARHLTGGQWPAITAGIIYAFLPYRFAHVPQLQLEAMEWFPLAFLSLHLFLERGRARYAAGLTACVVLCALCCGYYGVFLASALVVAMVVLAMVDPRARDGRRLLALGVAGCVAVALLTPFLFKYSRVSEKRGVERSIADIRARSADFSSYTSSGTPVHQALGMGSSAPNDYLFPGFLALALGGVGFATSVRRRLVVAYVAVAVFGWAASLGPEGPFGISLLDQLFQTMPVFRGLRQISRFGVVALFGLSVLAAFGCMAVESWLPRRRALWQAGIAAVAFLEVWQAPLRFDRPGGEPLMRVPETPEVYRWLAQQPGRFAILELPLPHYGVIWRNASYVYWSTAHWHSLVNGYSGFVPPSYASLWRILDNKFPDDLSKAALAADGVRYVIMHPSLFDGTDRQFDVDRLARAQWLRPVARFPDADVFEVEQEARKPTAPPG